MSYISNNPEVAGSDSNRTKKLNSLKKLNKNAYPLPPHIDEVRLGKEEQTAIKKKMAEDGVRKEVSSEVLSKVFGSLQHTVTVSAVLVCLSMYVPHEGNQSLLRFWIRTAMQVQTTLVSTYMRHTLGKQGRTKGKKNSDAS